MSASVQEAQHSLSRSSWSQSDEHAVWNITTRDYLILHVGTLIKKKGWTFEESEQELFLLCFVLAANCVYNYYWCQLVGCKLHSLLNIDYRPWEAGYYQLSYEVKEIIIVHPYYYKNIMSSIRNSDFFLLLLFLLTEIIFWCAELPHWPTEEFHPTMQLSNQEWERRRAPFSTVQRLTLTPSSTTTPAPSVTLGPMEQFSPIRAEGSWGGETRTDID